MDRVVPEDQADQADQAANMAAQEVQRVALRPQLPLPSKSLIQRNQLPRIGFTGPRLFCDRGLMRPVHLRGPGFRPRSGSQILLDGFERQEKVLPAFQAGFDSLLLTGEVGSNCR